MWDVYTIKYYSAIRKNEILPFAMDRLGGHYAKWNKSDRERQILYDITYTWNLKIQQTSEYNKKETYSQIRRTN